MKKEEKQELKQLFKELKNGNNDIVQEIYNKYRNIVYGVAFSILKNREDSEDVVQIVFAKLYILDKQKLPQDKEATWLYTVAKNEALTILKDKNNSIDLENIYDIQKENNEIDELINKETYNKMISGLNKKDKEIVSLKVLSNMTFNEIGDVLGVPSGTVKWRYYKSVYKLKTLLGNLSMSVIAFVLSLVAFKNGPKSADQVVENEEVEDKIEQNVIEEDKAEANKQQNIIENEEELRENIVETDIFETEENIMVEQEPEVHINYLGIGLFSLSAIFLTVTIVFTIIAGKDKMKLKKRK